MELSDAIHELRQMRQGRYVFDPADNPDFKGFIMDFPQSSDGIPIKISLELLAKECASFHEAIEGLERYAAMPALDLKEYDSKAARLLSSNLNVKAYVGTFGATTLLSFYAAATHNIGLNIASMAAGAVAIPYVFIREILYKSARLSPGVRRFAKDLEAYFAARDNLEQENELREITQLHLSIMGYMKELLTGEQYKYCNLLSHVDGEMYRVTQFMERLDEVRATLLKNKPKPVLRGVDVHEWEWLESIRAIVQLRSTTFRLDA